MVVSRPAAVPVVTSRVPNRSTPVGMHDIRARGTSSDITLPDIPLVPEGGDPTLDSQSVRGDEGQKDILVESLSLAGEHGCRIQSHAS